MRTHRRAPSATIAAGAGTTRGRRTLFGLACLCVLGLTAFLGSGAPSVGAAESYPGQGFLPDNRAWEMVSPPDKNGGYIPVNSFYTRSSSDGEALGYSSASGFADAHGSGVGFEYIAERDPAGGANGWATHSIDPMVPPNTPTARGALADSYFDGEFSPDLDRGVFAARFPISGTPADVAAVANLYRLTGLRTPGVPPSQVLTTCPLCAEPGGEPLPPLSSFPSIAQLYLPHLAGASSDLEDVLFESIQRLTADAPAQSSRCGTANLVFAPSPYFCAPRLYEWDHGQLRLASILPGEHPADSAVAGTGASYFTHTPHVISDGSDGHTRIEFTQPTDETGKTFSELTPPGQLNLSLSGVSSGNIFQRIDGAETIKLNEPEPGAPADTFNPAQYLDASADGERVFFKTRQALTEDATVGTARHLYMYDASKPEADPHNLTLLSLPAADVNGMIGIDEGGHYAYFTAPFDIYMWHDGAVTDIGHGPITQARSAIYTDGTQYLQARRQAHVTPDGRHLLFLDERSPLESGGYDHGGADIPGCTFGCIEVYVYSADTDTFQCASCNPSGATATRPADVFTDDGPQGVGIGTSHENHAISDDSRWVFFNTAEKLVPEDINGVTDAYEYDTQTEEVHLLSSGRDESGSYFLESSPSGEDVFIDTAQALSGWDTDASYDIYDARVGGGIAEPTPPPPACQGDACQPAPRQLNDPTPSSSAYAGPGNEVASASCATRARRAQRLARHAKRLRYRARRAMRHGNRRGAHRLARGAKANAKRAHRLSGHAKRCRRANRRAGR